MNDLILYPEDIARLDALLDEFVGKAQVLCAMVTGKDGTLLTYRGMTQAMDTTSIAALVTGSFSATYVIARLVGEAEFSTMLHQGRQRNIHIALINADFYLASVFATGNSVDRVNQEAQQCIRELNLCLQRIAGNELTAFLPDDEDVAAASTPAAGFEHNMQQLIDSGLSNTPAGQAAPPAGSPSQVVTLQHPLVTAETASRPALPLEGVGQNSAREAYMPVDDNNPCGEPVRKTRPTWNSLFFASALLVLLLAGLFVVLSSVHSPRIEKFSRLLHSCSATIRGGIGQALKPRTAETLTRPESQRILSSEISKPAEAAKKSARRTPARATSHQKSAASQETTEPQPVTTIAGVTDEPPQTEKSSTHH
jgi:predicted regulator of Ras-like GTPase activity (Roadblock/LC7/MglB family)